MTNAEMTSNIAIMYICMSNMNKMPCRKKLCITLTACGLLTFNMSKMNAQTNCPTMPVSNLLSETMRVAFAA